MKLMHNSSHDSFSELEDIKENIKLSNESNLEAKDSGDKLDDSTVSASESESKKWFDDCIPPVESHASIRGCLLTSHSLSIANKN
jgi:hypothetical protein